MSVTLALYVTRVCLRAHINRSGRVVAVAETVVEAMCTRVLVLFWLGFFVSYTKANGKKGQERDFYIPRLEQCSQIERRKPPTVYILALLMWLKLLLVYVENYYAVDGKVVVGLGIHHPPSASVIISTEVYCLFSPASCICILY